MRILSLFFPLVFISAPVSVHGQDRESFALNKPAQINTINTVSFTLPASKLNQLHLAKGQKLVLNAPVIVVNGDSIKTKHIRVRGTTSSYLRRKSLNVKLKRKALFGALPDTFSLTKFYAISMNMDRNYIRNRISCQVLKYMHLRVPNNCYTNVVINDGSEGLYMIFDPPELFAMDRCNSTFVIRRAYNESIGGLDFKNISGQQASSLRKKFMSIYKEILPQYHGEELYQKLEEVLDLDSYFVWLAFNHLFQNGDYSDELYLMWNSDKNRFEIIPWDFDDLLHPEPHEGFEKAERCSARQAYLLVGRRS